MWDLYVMLSIVCKEGMLLVWLSYRFLFILTDFKRYIERATYEKLRLVGLVHKS